MFLLSAVTASAHTPKPDPGPLAHIWDNAPGQIVTIVVILVAVGTVLTAIQPVWDLVVFVAKMCRKAFRRRDADEEYRIRQRQGFARFVVARLEELASKEDWRDDRFAELEAEVEVQGRERVLRWLRFSPYRQVTLRREKSLSKGLARTTDSLVVLEGDPGSGKSVALRHLAEQLGRKAREERSADSLIPLYVNLKEFRPLSRPVDGNAVHDFIIESLTRKHDRDVEHFLDVEFDRGMRDGTWLLLLDSFDEIPDVLSSTESDNAVAEYARAISDFLSGMRTSRAIIASREFRGPDSFRVPRFRIVPLTARQQPDLIKRSGLAPAAQDMVLEGIAVADPELRQMARNPMFLGLICEYIRDNGAFPPSSHAAYDAYLERRIVRDADRIMQRYGVSTDLVRAIAEETAFCMTDTEGLGLSPKRAELHTALAATGRVSVRLLDKVLDALEYTKLGRAVDDPAGTNEVHFTFAHRRFQEYFATRVVLRAPDRVPAASLLTNGRWRETAVTILQTQPPAATAPLLGEATKLLGPLAAAVETASGADADSPGFTWPPGALHLLQLLDAGLGRAPAELPAEIRASSARLLHAAWQRGRRHDQKWAVSVALVADRGTTLWLTEQAFRSGSTYLSGAGYSVVSRMADPPQAMYAGVRRTLLDLAGSGELKTEHITIKAQISRLPDAVQLQRLLRLLAAAPAVDLLLATLLTVVSALINPWLLIADALLLPALLRLLPPSFAGAGVRWEDSDTGGYLRTLDSFPAAIVRLLVLGGFVGLIPLFVAHPARDVVARPLVWVGFISVIYFATWPVSVAASARDDQVASPALWPVLPLYLAIRRCGEVTRQLRSSIKDIAVGLGASICGSAALAGIVLLWTNVRDSHWFVISIGALVALAFFRTDASDARESVRARLEARRFSRTVQEPAAGGEFGADELLALLAKVRSARAATVVLSYACGLDLGKSPALTRAVSDLSYWILVGSGATGLGPEVTEWIESSGDRASVAVRQVGGRVMDSMSRAVEQAELARQRQ